MFFEWHSGRELGGLRAETVTFKIGIQRKLLNMKMKNNKKEY
jgi:hypothetical protein